MTWPSTLSWKWGTLSSVLMCEVWSGVEGRVDDVADGTGEVCEACEWAVKASFRYWTHLMGQTLLSSLRNYQPFSLSLCQQWPGVSL